MVFAIALTAVGLVGVSQGALCLPQLQIRRVSGVDVPQGFTGLPVHR